MNFQRPPSSSASLNSLEQCVARLNSTTDIAQASVHRLDAEIHELRCLKNVIQFKRHCELVTENDIKDAQNLLSVELEPQIQRILGQVEQHIGYLQFRLERLEAEAEKKSKRLKEQQESHESATKPIIAQNKKLRSLRMKKNQLNQFLKNRSDDIEEKQFRLRNLLNRQPTKTDIKKTTPKKRPNSAQSAASQRRREDLKRELEHVQKQLEEQQHELEQMDSSTASHQPKPEIEAPVPDSDGVDAKLRRYSDQLRYFDDIIGTEFADDTIIVRELAEVCTRFCTELRKSQSQVTTSVIPKLQSSREHAVQQMSTLCKLLYPDGNAGSTMSQIIQRMLDSSEKWIYTKQLSEVFPPDEEKRHHAESVTQWLHRIGVLETAIEVERRRSLHIRQKAGEDNPKGELLLRFKFLNSSESE
ncbi:uncharacterized protein VTP21DRAFT_9289 [Calcarisporiella thermophila]|uniref:uncharacterized protein n=1 Tax=Calcarisporiella thermophila TaxID=911321 RepID=UPI0037438D81